MAVDISTIQRSLANLANTNQDYLKPALEQHQLGADFGRNRYIADARDALLSGDEKKLDLARKMYDPMKTEKEVGLTKDERQYTSDEEVRGLLDAKLEELTDYVSENVAKISKNYSDPGYMRLMRETMTLIGRLQQRSAATSYRTAVSNILRGFGLDQGAIGLALSQDRLDLGKAQFGYKKEEDGQRQVEAALLKAVNNLFNITSTSRLLGFIRAAKASASEAVRGNPVAAKNLLAALSRMGSDEVISDNELKILLSRDIAQTIQRTFGALVEGKGKIGVVDAINAIKALNDMLAAMKEDFESKKQSIISNAKDYSEKQGIESDYVKSYITAILPFPDELFTPVTYSSLAAEWAKRIGKGQAIAFSQKDMNEGVKEFKESQAKYTNGSNAEMKKQQDEAAAKLREAMGYPSDFNEYSSGISKTSQTTLNWFTGEDPTPPIPPENFD